MQTFAISFWTRRSTPHWKGNQIQNIATKVIIYRIEVKTSGWFASSFASNLRKVLRNMIYTLVLIVDHDFLLLACHFDLALMLAIKPMKFSPCFFVFA